LIGASMAGADDPRWAVLDLVPSMLAYWDADLRCRFANRAYEVWFGVSPEGLIGTSLQELLGPALFALNEPYVRGALAGQAQQFERMVPGPRGEQRHSLAHYRPDVREGKVVGIVVQVTDITPLHEARTVLQTQVIERENTVARLKTSERALRQAQRLGRIGSWEWDIARNVITWSDQLYEIFGRDPADSPPPFLAHATLYPAASLARWQAAVDATLQTGEPCQLDLEFVHASGHSGWLEARAEVERDDAGRVVKLHGTAQDITVRRQAVALRLQHQQLAGTTQRLSEEIAKSAELERALTQAKRLEVLGLLAGGIAHDFNNVLAAVSGSLQILKLTIKEARAQEFIGRGLRGVDRATRLVRQLTGFASTQNLAPQVVDLAQAISECHELLQMSAGPRVQVRVEVGPPCLVALDPGQFEMALLNLTINARDATDGPGKIVIRLHEAANDAGGERGPSRAGWVAVEVCDSGSGMAPEVLERARELFFTTKPAGKGTGLGLAMVSAFARHSGGSLQLESTPGQGTCATLVLPRISAELAALVQETQAEALDREHHGDATVLVVDDDELVRPVVAHYLSELGYTVIEASDGVQALELARATPQLDLVLTDVAMHGMDGIALAERLRRLHPDRPVLMMTGHADRRQLAGEEVLEKPFTQAALGARVLAPDPRLLAGLTARSPRRPWAHGCWACSAARPWRAPGWRAGSAIPRCWRCTSRGRPCAVDACCPRWLRWTSTIAARRTTSSWSRSSTSRRSPIGARASAMPCASPWPARPTTPSSRPTPTTSLAAWRSRTSAASASVNRATSSCGWRWATGARCCWNACYCPAPTAPPRTPSSLAW
jgi:PAS domain S-box-containing protein